MGELLLSTIVVPMDDKKIGIQLKKARSEAGFSQEEVAQKIGLTWEMISRYENGRSSALKHLRKFSDIYNKPLNFFIEDNKFQKRESFNLDSLVARLREEISEYSNGPQIDKVKLIEEISGRGLERDTQMSKIYVDAPRDLIEKYSEKLFACRLESFVNNTELANDAIGFFIDFEEAQSSEIVATFDGIDYKLEKSEDELDGAPVASLVALTQYFIET